MRNVITAIVAIMSMALLTFSSCKTSEENYRTAYETAKLAKDTGVDADVTAKIRQEAVPTTVTAEGDSIRMQTMFVSATKANDGSSHQILRYGVVVGQFKQVFNARAMVSRLTTLGYDDAYIVANSEPVYYVIAVGSDDITQANSELKRVATDKKLTLRAPLPWILQSASLNR